MFWKKFLHTISYNPTLQKAGGWWLAFYMKVLGWTCRVAVVGEDYHQKALDGGTRILYLLWHEQQMTFITFARKKLDLAGMVSLVEGGDRGIVLRYMMKAIGVGVSVPVQYEASSMTAGRNLLKLIRIMKNGKQGVVTPDGPDGPGFEVKKGAVFIAKKTGAMVIPSGSMMSSGFRLDRWDEYLIPYPFAKITMVFGKPFQYTEDLDDEKMIAKMNESLNAAREMARA